MRKIGLMLLILVFIVGCGLCSPRKYAAYGITGTAVEEMAGGNRELIIVSVIVLPITVAFDSVLLVPYGIPHDIYVCSTTDESTTEDENSKTQSPTKNNGLKE